MPEKWKPVEGLDYEVDVPEGDSAEGADGWKDAEKVPTQGHPDLGWARDCVKANKGERVTDEELDTLWWNGLLGCYMMQWRGMTLGIETDGYIHS